MKTLVKSKLIAAGFAARVWFVRARRVIASLGRPRLRAVDHLTLAVGDIAEAKEFYCDWLGASLLMTVDDAALARFGRPAAPNEGVGVHHLSVLMGGGTRVDLFLQREGVAPLTQGHPHVAFRVAPSELLRWKAKLEARGVPTEGPLQLGPPGQASLYFNDPFGNHLELVCMGFTREIPVRPPQMTGLRWGHGAA